MDDLDELLKNLDNPRASTRPSHRAQSTAVNYDELNELMQDLASPIDTQKQSSNHNHAQNRVSQAPYSSDGSDGLDDLLNSLSGPGGQHQSPPQQAYQPPSARNTQQPIRNTQQPVRNTQQPVRNTQSAAQLDDLDELLRNLGPPSSSSNNQQSSYDNRQSTYSQPSYDNRQSTYGQPAYDNRQSTYGQPSYDNRQSVASVAPVNRNTQQPVRNTQQPVRPQPQAQPQQNVARPSPAGSGFKPSGRVLDGPDLDDMLRDINRTSTRGLDGGPSSRGDCAHCRKPILGEVIQALNRTYHPEHFVCGNCQSPLGTNNFYEQDGLPNCERCYQELFCSRCAHCDEPITGKCITALNRKWHADHFICGQCLGPFPGGTFFEKEGRPFCENCFHNAFSSKCAGCQQSIKGECINALGQQWHPEHFVCQYCQKSFGTGSFYEFNSKPYCETHYHQQTGSLCAGCGKAVTGRMVNALDKKWHPEHFVCSFCMHPLAGGAFTENGGKAYCKECHGKLFG